MGSLAHGPFLFLYRHIEEKIGSRPDLELGHFIAAFWRPVLLGAFFRSSVCFRYSLSVC